MGRPLKAQKMKKTLIVPMTVGQHTRLKFAARKEGRSMSAIVREVVDQYLETPHRRGGDAEVYEELSAKIHAVLES